MTENKHYYVTVIHGLCRWARTGGTVQEILENGKAVLPSTGWTELSTMGDVLYGPYTKAGAERVAKRVLNEFDGTQYLYPVTGWRYVAGAGSYFMVKVTPHAPYSRQARRNMPLDSNRW